MKINKFKSRKEAGLALAEKLKNYRNTNTFVIALARGGVPVGYEVAMKLDLPFDVIISRKIGAPTNPELAIGAISEGDVLALNEKLIHDARFSSEAVDDTISKEIAEIERRIAVYRDHEVLPNLEGKNAVIVDDGLATGYTALVSIRSIKNLNPNKIIFAAPICAKSSINIVKNNADEVICILSPENLNSISEYYEKFNQVEDEEVLHLLAQVRQKLKSKV